MTCRSKNTVHHLHKQSRCRRLTYDGCVGRHPCFHFLFPFSVSIATVILIGHGTPWRRAGVLALDSEARVKHDRAWSPNGWVTLTESIQRDARHFITCSFQGGNWTHAKCRFILHKTIRDCSIKIRLSTVVHFRSKFTSHIRFKSTVHLSFTSITFIFVEHKSKEREGE